ncbi:MAG: HAMP domain-containing histidine kinase [Chloroflexota bacterium]|nr:HAMP domain-containing histidine kinase [Chloroflexota bacterium]
MGGEATLDQRNNQPADTGSLAKLVAQAAIRPDTGDRASLILAAVTALLAVAWLVLVFLVDSVRFVVLDPKAKTGFEVFLAIGQTFGAFVLALSPLEAAVVRLRWVAAGLLVFGIGALGYGYLYSLLVDSPHLSATMYGSLFVRSVGTLLCAVGLAPPNAPRVQPRPALALAVGFVILGIGLVPLSHRLPALISISGVNTIIDHNPDLDRPGPVDHLHLVDLEARLSTAATTVPGLTGWHWAFAAIPLVFSVIAVWGLLRRASQHWLGAWLLVALVLLAASQLHSLFWPSMYSSILTTTSLLRAGVAVTFIVGGVLELRHVIVQRDALLAEEQERTRRLEELAALKADFTSIVAHELANPVAAINAMSQMMTIDDLPDDLRRKTAEDIQAEARLLQMLVADVSDSARVERDDFAVRPRRVAVDRLIAEAEAYARTLPGEHPVSVEHAAHVDVQADPDRIGQVLRNLLSNAARHTPAGTPIAIRTSRRAGKVVVEVADKGPGIAPEDRARIFEKFGQGRDSARRDVSGRGLGLYLSQRILQGHHSALALDSRLGEGTAFHFALEVVP